MPKSGPVAFFSDCTIFEATDVPPEKFNERGTLQGKSIRSSIRGFVLLESGSFQLLAVAIIENFQLLLVEMHRDRDFGKRGNTTETSNLAEGRFKRLNTDPTQIPIYSQS